MPVYLLKTNNLALIKWVTVESYLDNWTTYCVGAVLLQNAPIITHFKSCQSKHPDVGCRETAPITKEKIATYNNTQHQPNLGCYPVFISNGMYEATWEYHCN